MDEVDGLVEREVVGFGSKGVNCDRLKSLPGVFRDIGAFRKTDKAVDGGVKRYSLFQLELTCFVLFCQIFDDGVSEVFSLLFTSRKGS